MKSSYSRFSDLLFIFVWTIVTFIFIINPILRDNFIRTFLGIPMVLFIPGYVLIAALYPKRNDLDNIERIALSFGLSIATIILLSLFLSFTFGIRLIPILMTITIYTIILILATIYRRKNILEEDLFTVRLEKILGFIKNDIKPKDKIGSVLTLVLVCMVILAIGMIFYVITMPKIGEKFTEFYIVNASGNYNDYPVELKMNESATFLIGVTNHEYSIINYTINVALDKDVLNTEEIILNHNETWKENITFVPNKKGENVKLELLLFKDKNFTNEYRSLHLWVNTT